ncbi:hypothetical protein GCK32_021103, partial [Trichostrongylus colubriformis]
VFHSSPYCLRCDCVNLISFLSLTSKLRKGNHYSDSTIRFCIDVASRFNFVEYG